MPAALVTLCISLQARHSEFRQTAEALQERSQAALKDLQTKLQSSENQWNAAHAAQNEAELNAQQLVNQAMADMGHHRVSRIAACFAWSYATSMNADGIQLPQDNAVSLAKDKQQLVTNNDNLRKQIELFRHQLQEAQGNFEREVSCLIAFLSLHPLSSYLCIVSQALLLCAGG